MKRVALLIRRWVIKWKRVDRVIRAMRRPK